LIDKSNHTNQNTYMKVTVIGAGNGGQAIAGHMAAIGHQVYLYDRNEKTVADLKQTNTIELTGCIECIGKLAMVTNNLKEAVEETDIIMVVTTATAHRELARQMSKFLDDGQTIVLNPGRTGGALEFRNILRQSGLDKHIYVAEAQTLVYACRLRHTGSVNIIGVKERVLLAALPSSDTEIVIKRLRPLYRCFYPAPNILATGFENIGAVFHPCVVLFNEAAIERGQHFFFYRDMTPALSRMIEAIDHERLLVAKAYGIRPISAVDWVAYAYTGVEGNTLCERMQNNPAYYEILAPTSIECRQITEDIPTGIIPMAELGRAAHVATPMFDALITMCSTLLQRNFTAEGRTLKNLGLEKMCVSEILKAIAS